MNSRTRLAKLEGTRHLCDARAKLLDEGQGELQAAMVGAEASSAHFRTLAGERPLTRAETYDWFLAGQRQARAEQGMTLGHAQFEYVTFENIDRAVSLLSDVRDLGAQVGELPGLWNLPARTRARGALHAASRQFSECFRTEVLGMPPAVELEFVWEESQLNSSHNAFFSALEREQYVDAWQLTEASLA